MRDLWHSCRHGFQRDAEKDLSREVACKILECRLATARGVWQLCVALLAPVVAAQVVQDLYPECWFGGAQANELQYVTLIVGYSILSTYRIWPQILSVKTLNVWTAFWMLLCTLHDSPVVVHSKESILLGSIYSMIMTTLISVGNLNLTVAVFWNALHAVANILSYARAEGTMEVATTPIFVSTVVFCLIAKLFIIYILGRSIDGGRGPEGDRGHAGEEPAGGTELLLDIVCDAVLELDSRLCFVDHVPALAHMLIHGSGRSLQGLGLSQFLAEPGDQALFEESIASAGTGTFSSAKMFHAKVKDAMGNRIRMQFFHVAFTLRENCKHHLVGLREDVDCWSLDEAQEGTEGLETIQETHQLGVLAAGMQTPPFQPMGLEFTGTPTTRSLLTSTPLQDFMVEGQNSSSQDSSRRGGSDAFSNADEVQVDVLAKPSLPLCYASSKFVARFGEVVRGSCLSSWMPGSEEFQQWVQARSDEICARSRPPMVVDFGYLLVVPRGAAG
eukprot:CAMPEP_0115449086 /NCGR_PEP_ID=MMETSP0271-20121206/40828_1 /TAXON_ID=71861 /ORGANISM="Scrippsiella trochoidea, Strain CCMP3099" /LENGTH=501 /DNA_ID=CAMNT_0002875233 /DNA_START=137 /DNA_END=1639 /DNA_ORIENTATION=-